jgi:hypothetical protein
MMKQTIFMLAVVTGLICTTVSLESLARVSITEVENRVTTLEDGMPAKIETSLVNAQLAAKADRTYVDKQLDAIQLTPGSQGPIGGTGAQGPKGDMGTAGLTGIAGFSGADGTNGASCSVIQGNGNATLYDSSLVEGFNAGDTLFWEDGQWQIVRAPSEASSKPLVLTFLDGAVSWNVAIMSDALMPYPSKKYYALGETGPAGGTVFYITHGGRRGLEAAPDDSKMYGGIDVFSWGCNSLDVPIATKTSEYSSVDTVKNVKSGAINTAAILETCKYTISPAHLASTYSYGGYDDWYLPSLSELQWLLSNRRYIPGFENYPYWSSSQLDATHGWLSHGGSPYTLLKSRKLSVRAIRSF